VSEEISPIDDLRSTADYRRQVTVNLLRRFWAETG
jgi:xanthine dehydrogenase iron-sulfur cluster and FAD-binding subunit A